MIVRRPQGGGMAQSRLETSGAQLDTKRQQIQQNLIPSRKGQRKLDLYSYQVDPSAVVQTGPGLPKWTWDSVSLTWNGPVDRGQQITLRLMSPTTNLVLAFFRVLLLGLLVMVVIRAREYWPKLKSRSGTAAAMALLSLAAASPARAAQDGFPSPTLLQQLTDRLTEPPNCLPVRLNPGLSRFGGHGSLSFPKLGEFSFARYGRQDGLEYASRKLTTAAG